MCIQNNEIHTIHNYNNNIENVQVSKDDERQYLRKNRTEKADNGRTLPHVTGPIQIAKLPSEIIL